MTDDQNEACTEECDDCDYAIEIDPKLLAYCQTRTENPALQNALEQLHYGPIESDEDLNILLQNIGEDFGFTVLIDEEPYDLEVFHYFPNLAAMWIEPTRDIDLTTIAKLKNLDVFSLNGPVSRLPFLGEKLISLNILEAPHIEIEKLEGYTKVDSLLIQNSPLPDYSGLAGLTQLKTLELVGGDITELSQLPSSESVTQLDLSHQRLTSLEGIDKFPNLHTLTLASNLISDLSPLPRLPKLRRLSICYNPCQDLATLAKLTQLDTLFVRGLSLPHLGFIEAMKDLRVLNGQDNHISDLTPLASKEKLAFVNLSQNNLTSLAALERLPALKEVDAAHNHISVLSSFATELDELDLSHNLIGDLNEIAGIAKNTPHALNLNNNLIRDLSPIPKYFPKLYSLEINHNRVDSLEPLAELHELSRINASHNRIVDISVLARLPQLTGLDLDGNRIQDFGVLKEIPGLKHGYCEIAENPVGRTIRRTEANHPIETTKDRTDPQPLPYFSYCGETLTSGVHTHGFDSGDEEPFDKKGDKKGEEEG